MTAAMLPSLQRVIASTIRGAFVADAASMGTHWIYNPQEVLEKITSREQPEFREPPSPNYYSSTEFPNHYMSGMLSPYGEQLLFVTQYTANTVGDDANAMTGPAMSTAMYEWATTFGGRPDHATTTFIENMKAKQMYPECGADDDQGMFFVCSFFWTRRTWRWYYEITSTHICFVHVRPDSLLTHQENSIFVQISYSAYLHEDRSRDLSIRRWQWYEESNVGPNNCRNHTSPSKQ